MLQPDASSLLRFAREVIIVWNMDGVIEAWNPTAEKLYGYTAAEIVGRQFSTLLSPESRQQLPLVLEQLRHGHSIEDLESLHLSRDGRPVNVSLSFYPIRDDMTKVTGILTFGQDLSVLKRLDRAERDQLFLGSIVASADDAIISKDLRGIVTSWNAAAEKIFGYTTEEMVGESITKLIPADHVDEEPQILERIRRGERIDHYESQRRRKDGLIIDVSLTISPIRDRMGRVVGASKIARDVTERRKWKTAEIAQSFLGALVESAEDAIISKDLHGIITSWNSAAEKLYGYTAQEIIGKPVAMLIPPDHPDEEPQILERIRRGQRIQHYETKRVRKDGSLIDVALTVSPIKDTLGRIIGASKIARDITERKRAEMREREVLQQAQEARRLAERARQQAEEASRTKDEFLATISHELRTPLTSILGWTRMLVNGHVAPERQQKAFETIDRNARSQAQLVEDLLDISRIVSGKLRVDFKTVDLAAVVTAAVEAVRPSGEAKGIRINAVFSSGAGPVIGDADRLQQVVWNLLSNAIKFTPRKGWVQIELRRVESQVELRVTDNGIGIEPRFLPHVFDRFTQADSSITRTRGGLGMGLAIVKSLVELHGGTVSASSSGEGQGAMFTVKLPISAVPDPKSRRPIQKPVLEQELQQREDLVGLKILVVDDEPDTCEMLQFIFAECGAVVQTAQSAGEGLKLFDTWHPDILISDIGMPDVDGYELIRAIRQERHSRIPAIALTAMARIDDRIKALTAGYQMHVAKPVEPVELITITASLVGLVNRQPPL